VLAIAGRANRCERELVERHRALAPRRIVARRIAHITARGKRRDDDEIEF